MDLVDKDGLVYVEICKGAYGLNQEARVAFDHLVKLLKPHKYYTLRYNPGIWRHEMLPTKFALCVENFRIKYTKPAHSRHLDDTIKKYYTISIAWRGGN